VAKKADIGSKEFSKLLKSLKYKPNSVIIKKLDSRMFSLDMNRIINYKPEQLAFKEFKRCLELFQERNPGLSPDKALQRVAGTQTLLIKAEAPHKLKLEQLAINTIREIYQVPDYVDLKGIISPRLSLDTEQDDSPDAFLDLTLQQKNNMRDEIQKRILLNSLVHGSSMHVWKGIYHLVSEELDRINPQLRELYNYYTSTVGMEIWMMNPDAAQAMIENNSQITQGYNQLKFDKQNGFGGQVKALGLNFAVLLHELNKGVIDWLISAGIPKEYSESELRYYYAIADDYKNEPWHYLLGPSLWSGLLEAAQVPNEKIPKLISNLVKLSYPELVDLFRLIQDDQSAAKDKMKLWKI
jgi:hypothetical protein